MERAPPGQRLFAILLREALNPSEPSEFQIGARGWSSRAGTNQGPWRAQTARRCAEAVVREAGRLREFGTRGFAVEGAWPEGMGHGGLIRCGFDMAVISDRCAAMRLEAGIPGTGDGRFANPS
jgi:hypothetical protein